MQAVSEAGAPTEAHVKRVELLLHENNILTKQNAELDKEVARLNTDNDGLAKQLLDTTQKYGETCVTLKHKDAEVLSMSSTCVSRLSDTSSISTRTRFSAHSTVLSCTSTILSWMHESLWHHSCVI